MSEPSAGAPDPASTVALARQVVRLLREAGCSLATAESLTGGLVGAALTSVPGASRVYRGGVVAYATDLKSRLLGVDEKLLARVGAVDPAVAVAMATGVRERLGADYGVAVTGVAGPDAQDGHAPGTVWLGLAGPHGAWAADVSCPGDRDGIRARTTTQALAQLLDALLAAAEQGDGDLR